MFVRRMVAILVACAVFFAGTAVAFAETRAFWLVVESDAPESVSAQSLTPALEKELGGTIVPRTVPSRATITIRYAKEARSIKVRVDHEAGRTLEREVEAEGDDAAIRREIVLLAGNLARDEASELLDALGAKKPPPPPPPEPAPVPEPPRMIAPRPPPFEGRDVVALSFVFPVATNMRRPNTRASFAASMFYGRVGRLDGFALGTGVTYASRTISGMQLAGLGAFVGGRVDGMQLGGLATYAGGSLHGSQIGGLTAIADDVEGLQLAGAVNVAQGRVDGAQIGGALDIATDRVVGAQISGINYASGIEGAQLACINLSGDVRGTQIGIINIASGRVRGTQIGFLNIADEVDVAIGAASIAKDNIHPIFWSSNLSYMNLGVKFRSKYLYTISAAGFGTLEAGFDAPSVSFTVALGSQWQVNRNVDLGGELAFSHQELDTPGLANEAFHHRAVVGYSFVDHFRIFAGLGVRDPIVAGEGSRAVRPEGSIGMSF